MSKVDDWPTLTNDDLVSTSGESNDFENFCNLNIPCHRGLTMANLNINSLVRHIDELRIFMSSTKIDILCINETKCDSSISDHEVCLPGFELVRRDRSVNGRIEAEVFVYIFESNLNFIERYDLISETLENLTVEIKKPRSKSILVSTWYRPPDSPISHFSEFEKMIGLMDAENLEYFLLGDLNIDCLSTNNSPNRDKITEIFDIYGLEQMINEPTRITDKSSTLIDLCITNSPANVVNSGVLHLSISDHSLVYMIRKAQYKRNGSRIVEFRSLKNFSRENFLRDLELKQWSNVHCLEDPNEMWATWKSMLMETIDKHAPCRLRRIGKKRSSWITNYLKRQMFKRDYLKKKAISSEDP